MKADTLPQGVLRVLSYIARNKHQRTLRDAENDLGPTGVYSAMLLAWNFGLVETAGETPATDLPEYAYRRVWSLTEKGRRALAATAKADAHRVTHRIVPTGLSVAGI